MLAKCSVAVGAVWCGDTGKSGRMRCGLGMAGLWVGKSWPAPFGGDGSGVAELVITGAVYWFLLLMLRSFRGQDLNYVPGGKVLRAFGKTLRLL